MRELFKIGEIAKLYGVNIQTLRYYDQIGLLKAAFTDPDSGYRFYSIEQFEQLNTIRYLRTQGMSLDDIRVALDHRNPAKIRNLFKQQERAVEQQIEELKNTQARLAERIQQITNFMDTSILNLLRFQELPPRPIVVLNQSICVGECLEIPLRSLEKRNGIAPSYFLGKVGLSMALEDLKAGCFDQYQNLFCLMEPGEANEARTGTLPGGRWALWRFRGSHDGASAQYAELLRQLRERSLIPAGDGAEFALLDYGLTENVEEYITELQIPVTSAA